MILLRLFLIFFRIGSITFGGGYAMISIIQQEVVHQGFCTELEFADMVSLSQMTPGPIALNTATFLGKTTAGIPGSIAATFGLIMPSIIIITFVLWFVNKVDLSKWIGAIKGVRAAALGLVTSAVWFFAETSLFKTKPITGTVLEGNIKLNWNGIVPMGIGVFILAFLGAWKLKLSPPKIIFLSIFLGISGFYIDALFMRMS